MEDVYLVRHLIDAALAQQGLTVLNTTTQNGLLILNGCNGGVQVAGVVCPDDVLCDPETPRHLRNVYTSLQSSHQYLVLLTEPGRESVAQDLLNEVVRVAVLPALPPRFD